MKFKDIKTRLFGGKDIKTKTRTTNLPINFRRGLGCGVEHENVNSAEAIELYNQISTIYTATDILSNEIANIRIQVFDKKAKEFINDAPILKLIESPNTDIIGSEMAYNEASFYSITANTYWMGLGAPDSELLEYLLIKPQNVSAITDGSDFVTSYTVNTGSKSDVFTPTEDKTGKTGIRYFDKKGNELWHVRGFNPNVSPFGLSKLTNLFYECTQFIEASKTNSATFKNGANPGGVITLDPDMSQDDKEFSREAFSQNQVGSRNNKRWLVAAGLKDIKVFNTTPRDMDFGNLMKTLDQSIFKAYRIPLALVDPDAIRFKNADSTVLDLYDRGVFPLINRILAEKTRFLMHRYYPDPENFELTYDPKTIAALESRFLDQALTRKKIEVETSNEIRALMDIEPHKDGNELIINIKGASKAPQESESRKQFMKETERLKSLDRDYLTKVADDAGL